LHAKSPTFWAAKLKGFTVYCILSSSACYQSSVMYWQKHNPLYM